MYQTESHNICKTVSHNICKTESQYLPEFSNVDRNPELRPPTANSQVPLIPKQYYIELVTFGRHTESDLNSGMVLFISEMALR